MSNLTELATGGGADTIAAPAQRVTPTNPLPVALYGPSSSQFVSGSASATGTSGTAILAAPGAGLRNYITGVMLANSGGSSSVITIQSDPAGTPVTLATLFNPTLTSNAFNLGPVPLVGGVNKAVGFTAGTGSNAQTVTLIGYVGP
jgi:hypothetical protein